MGTRMRRGAGGLALIGGVVVAFRPGTAANRALRRGLRAGGRRLRYAGGQLRGSAYRLSGGHPDPNVTDAVLADRIRSSLGPIEKRLDLPRIHVTVENHVAVLHGEVGKEADVEELVAAVGRISGVAGVESHLHVGLLASDTRPSEGRAAEG